MGKHANGVANDWPDVVDSVLYTIVGMTIYVSYTIRVNGGTFIHGVQDVEHFRGRHVDTDNGWPSTSITRIARRDHV